MEGKNVTERDEIKTYKGQRSRQKRERVNGESLSGTAGINCATHTQV